MILCDLCNQWKDCLLKEIEGKEYDICAQCWEPLAEKLKGKGRTKRKRDSVFLPSVTREAGQQESKPPAEPPKIWGGVGLRQ
jgi:hypothetical protein